MPATAPRRRRFAISALTVGVGAAFVLVALLANLTDEILEAVSDHNGIAGWDRPVLDWAIASRTPGLTQAAQWFTNSGGAPWEPIILLSVAGLLAWRWRDWTPVVLAVISVGGAMAITVVGKTAIGRPRPPISDAVPPFETSFSFPSGHTMAAAAGAGIIAYLLIWHGWTRPRWQRVLVGTLAGLYLVAMGFSRVFLGYHWLTDVLAAVCLGTAWLIVVLSCHRLWLRFVAHRGHPDGYSPKG